MNYTELENKTALNKLKRKIPYGWDLNLYRGCEHGCKYCYAISSHDYLKDGKFFDNVYYKKNIIESLERELSSPEWKREIINIGGVTDSYQNIERELKLMPEVLKLMIKYRNPIIISTKSDLILRDIDLLNELSRITYVNVACTITTMDENIRGEIEPNASESINRFKVLKEFKEKTNCSVGVHLMPIIPYITDNYENLEKIYYLASKAKVDYVLPGTMYLLGKTKTNFFEFMEKYDDCKYDQIKNMYIRGSASKEYKNQLYAKINMLKEKYNVSSNYMKVLNEKIN